MSTSTSQLPRRTFLAGVAGLGAVGALAACSSGSEAPSSSGGGSTPGQLQGTINGLFMKQAGYSEQHIRQMAAAFKKANPGVTVNMEFVAYEALHDKIVAAAAAGTYDLVFIDVIWPAELASKGLIADISDRIPANWSTDILPGALNSAVYQKKFYGIPWLLDTKYFYFNKAMLSKAGIEPSSVTTWDGVAAAAKTLKSKGIVKYPLMWSWSQAEAVICDWAALTASFGGKLFDDSGQPAFTSGGAVQALEFMRRTLVDGLTNPSSTQSLEDDVVKVVSAGDAAMGLNWTYMFAAANDPKQSKVAGDVVITEVPNGGAGRMSVNGSSALSITATTKNPDAAWAFAKFVSSQKIQEKYVSDSLPIWKASYDSPSVIKSAPEVVPVAKEQLANMVNRPQVVNYNAISQKLQVAVQKALLGEVDPKQAMTTAAGDVEQILKQ